MEPIDEETGRELYEAVSGPGDWVRVRRAVLGQLLKRCEERVVSEVLRDGQLWEASAAERKIRILEAEIRWLESLADQPDALGVAAHKIATLEAQLTQARAAERELCAKVADEMRDRYRAEADLAGDQPTAQNNLRHSGLGAGAVADAIRALPDPGS